MRPVDPNELARSAVLPVYLRVRRRVPASSSAKTVSGSVRRRPRSGVMTRLTLKALSNRTLVAARLSALAFLIATLSYGLMLGGHFDVRGGSLRALVDEGSAIIGLSAQQITVRGLREQSRETVLAAIAVEEGRSLVGFDAARARSSLEALDWVAHASVLRLFPNQLLVEVVERVPYALWQDRGELYVVDRNGAVMTSLHPRAYADLPLVVGEGANEAAESLVNHLEAQPALQSMVAAASRVAERRWTLHLANGIRVMLPQENVSESLSLLMAMIDRHGLMTRDIESVDLRLAGRVAVRLTEAAFEKKKSASALARAGSR